jgi:hypothetical protein
MTMLCELRRTIMVLSDSKKTGTVWYYRHFQNSFKLIQFGNVYSNTLYQFFFAIR